MPSVLTHYGFNKLVFDNKINFLKNNEDIYLLGAQGPDPFFFYGIVPFFKSKNSKTIRKYGTKLHKLVPDEVFKVFFKYADDSKNKDVLYAYILGAGLHYLLDRKIHPYVYYKTGFSDDKKKKAKYYVDHTLFETNLDVLLMDSVFKSYKVKASESIKSDEDKVEVVSEMYGYLAKNLVEEEKINDDSFEDAYKQMFKIEKLLYSKRGIKKGIVNCLFKRTPFNTMMHPKVVKDDYKIDYLNLAKKEWIDPSLEIPYNKSVLELFEEAKEEVKEWFDVVKNYYNGLSSEEDLKKFTKDIIYSGHSKDKKMKVFKNVYEREEK